MSSYGSLYIVATPIGNLADITQRALTTLAQVDFIAAEDTRHSSRLLQHYGIQTALISLHEFNETQRVPTLLNYLHAGKSIALISDAGTPLISDPGYILVQAVRATGVQVIPIPGACAAIAALSAAGLPTDHFLFAGFLSSKSSDRQKQLQLLRHETPTLIFYEAPHRILKLLEDVALIFGSERRVVLAKEITKTFETFFAGTAAEACSWLNADPYHQKGEFVVLVHGAELQDDAGKSTAENTRILEILVKELPLKQAVMLAAQITGEKKNKLYDLAVKKM